MKRRWKLWLALAVLLGSLIAQPAVHWRMIGLVRGEAFYQGRPTSWWKAEIRALYEQPPTSQLDPATTPMWFRRIPRGPLDNLEETLMNVSYGQSYISPELLQGDSEALPVLLELLRSDDVQYRLVGIDGVRLIGPPARVAVPALREARQDVQAQVRVEASRALQAILRPD